MRFARVHLHYAQDTWLVRLVFQRSLAVVYLVAFASAYFQFPALLGERGLLPIRRFIERVPFSEAPSVFYARRTDRFVRGVALAGIALSLAALTGLSERGPMM